MRARVVLLSLVAAVVFAVPLLAHAGGRPGPASPGHSQSAVEYTQLPFAAFNFVNGRLTARWDVARYDVSDVVLTADYEPVEAYAPGRPKPFVLDERKTRYDIVGWMTDRETGARSRFISPVWTPAGFVGEDPSSDGNEPLSCTLTESVDCPDGSTVSVMCSGMTGSCLSCSVGTTACCRASTQGDEVFKNGRVQRVIIITRESESCPPPPEPRPDEQPPRTLR